MHGGAPSRNAVLRLSLAARLALAEIMLYGNLGQNVAASR